MPGARRSTVHGQSTNGKGVSNTGGFPTFTQGGAWIFAHTSPWAESRSFEVRLHPVPAIKAIINRQNWRLKISMLP